MSRTCRIQWIIEAITCISMTFVTTSVEVRSLVNIARYAPGEIFGPRVMTSHEFVWLREGSATWEILGSGGGVTETHRLIPGVMALAPHGVAERWVWDAARPSSHAFVHFDLPPEVDASAWARTRAMSECPPLAALADSLFAIGSAGEDIAPIRSGQVIGLMLELFLAGPVVLRQGAAASLSDRVAEYVRGTWLEGGIRIVGIAELAGAVGVSAGHLSRSFHDRYGVGPAGALELIRLGRVAVSLQRTSMLLAEIARGSGFTDEFHMSRRFSRIYGVPPGAYRRAHLDAEPLQPIIAARLMPLWNAVLTHTPVA